MAKKRLIVACDGTWMNSDNGFKRDSYLPWSTGSLQTPTNVTRICRAIPSDGDDHGEEISQVVYYQAGIGTENSWWDKLLGGGTGLGLSENIREAYSFLSSNYTKDDEIFLIGFSRGAFTARSIAAMISNVGLLTRKGMASFYEIFNDWENQLVEDYEPKLKGTTLAKIFDAKISDAKKSGQRPKVTDPAYRQTLEDEKLSTLNIPIRAIAVWDTVGSLGIPELGILPRHIWSRTPPSYAFVDTAVSPNVENAFHALALDERRRPFSPTIWENPDRPSPPPEGGLVTLQGGPKPLNLKQCWFPGDHSNIGGSHSDTGIADITLAWMISQLSPLLSFDPELIKLQHDQYYEDDKNHKDHKYNENDKTSIRPWGTGRIYDMTSFFTKFNPRTRTPGQYSATNPKTGEPTGRGLENTGETIHASVRVRKILNGIGTVDRPAYEPESLNGWQMVGNGHEGDESTRRRWVCKAKKEEPIVLLEEKLGEVELKLLELSPEAKEAYETKTYSD